MPRRPGPDPRLRRRRLGGAERSRAGAAALQHPHALVLEHHRVLVGIRGRRAWEPSPTGARIAIGLGLRGTSVHAPLAAFAVLGPGPERPPLVACFGGDDERAEGGPGGRAPGPALALAIEATATPTSACRSA